MFERKTVMKSEAESKEKRGRMKRPERTDGTVKVRGAGALLKSLVLPLLLTLAVVSFIYLVMQHHAENEIEKSKVVLAIQDVDANTRIDAKDIGKYFAEKNVDASLIPDNAVRKMKDLPEGGIYVTEDLSEKQMLSGADFAESDSMLEKYANGYTTTSVSVEDYDNSVSGRIRHGDLVDLYAKNPDTGTLDLLAENIYVENAYDSSGALITNDDGVAVDFTVRVAPGEELPVNEAIAWGGIQMYRVR